MAESFDPNVWVSIPLMLLRQTPPEVSTENAASLVSL